MARFSTGDVITTGASGRSTNQVVVRSNGSWTVPPDVTCATFELWGGGGAGGARCCCDCYHQGFPGGPGSYTKVQMPVIPGTVYSLFVGTGGWNDSAETTPSHPYCCGTSGGATYISGTGINTLCAAGGSTGNNDCYQACLCSPCFGQSSYGSCINVTGSAAAISCLSTAFTNTCNDSAGGTKQNNAHVGLYSDANGRYYPQWTSGVAFQSGKITPVNHCSSFYWSLGQMNCTQFGQGGSGIHSINCCMCNSAGTGRNGAIVITF